MTVLGLLYKAVRFEHRDYISSLPGWIHISVERLETCALEAGVNRQTRLRVRHLPRIRLARVCCLRRTSCYRLTQRESAPCPNPIRLVEHTVAKYWSLTHTSESLLLGFILPAYS